MKKTIVGLLLLATLGCRDRDKELRDLDERLRQDADGSWKRITNGRSGTPQETEIEKMMSFECAQQYRALKAVSGLSAKCQAELAEAQKK